MHRISISIYSLLFFCLLLVLVKQGITQVDVLSDIDFNMENLGHHELVRPKTNSSSLTVKELLRRKIKFLEKMVNCINNKTRSLFCRIVRRIHKFNDKIYKRITNRISTHFFDLSPKAKAKRIQGIMHRFWTKYCLKQSFSVKVVYENCVLIAKIYKMEQKIGFLKFFAKNERKILTNINPKDPPFPEILKRTYKAMQREIEEK